METKAITCSEIKDVLVDVVVEADLGGMLPYLYHRLSLEKRAVALERAVKEFRDFLEDHRSQDMVYLTIKRVTENCCSNCGKTWDTYEDEGGEYCGYCGALVCKSDAEGE